MRTLAAVGRSPGGKVAAGRLRRDLLEHLTRHRWPGNVRELQSTIECAVMWCTGPTIRRGDLPPELAC